MANPAVIRIGNRAVGDGEPVYVIAEIGINHNGSLDLAKKMIEGAAAAGCDAVKFQKRTPELCVPKDQWNIERDTPWGRMTYLAYRHKVEFDADGYAEIDRTCKQHGIQWFASAWDEEAVRFLETFDMPCYKSASASLTDVPLLKAMKATGRPLIMSTGMSTMKEIESAVSSIGTDKLLIAHSTSTYPCPVEQLNLRMIHTLKAKYPECAIGYSGHETGLAPTWAAVAMGATHVERHITVDRAMWGSDQAASVELSGVQRLVSNIRDIEKALGDGVKRVHESELAAAKKLRRVWSLPSLGRRAVQVTIQALALPIIITAAVVYIVLERLFPYTQGQKLVREGFWNDFLMYTIVQSLILGQAIDAFVRFAAGRWRVEFVTAWPLWAQVTFFFVVHDFYIYSFHRLQHANKYLWRTHEAHHSVREVDWLAGSRSHPLEIIVNQTIEFAPIALLGAPPEVAAIKAILDAVWGMWIHSNVNVHSGWLQYVFNGPEMHRWHHKDDISDGVHNFGTKLAIWDWIFGTAYNPESKPLGYGILDYEFPETVGARGFVANAWGMVRDYFAQTAFSFRRFPPGKYVPYTIDATEAARRRAQHRLRAGQEPVASEPSAAVS